MRRDTDERQTLHELMLENQRLITENNQLLKRMHRMSIWSFWIRLGWTLFLIGIPFVLYYFVIQPYFESLGSSFDTFQEGLQEVPGWKQFYEQIGGDPSGGE